MHRDACRCGQGFRRGATTTGCTSLCHGSYTETCGASSKVDVYEVLSNTWSHGGSKSSVFSLFFFQLNIFFQILSKFVPLFSFTFLVDPGPFCGDTGTLCSDFQRVATSFKVRVHASWPVLYCHFNAIICELSLVAWTGNLSRFLHRDLRDVFAGVSLRFSGTSRGFVAIC